MDTILFSTEFLGIVAVSVRVALTSVSLATLVGVPLGIFIALKKIPGHRAVVTIINTLMSLPTVVVGLMTYSLLSRSGPLGHFGILYSVTAMVIGQFCLAVPIISGLTISSMNALDTRIQRTITSLGANSRQGFFLFLLEARYGLMAAIVAGFGRVFGEIGVSMMLGGNIKGYTRNITTTIALETSKGEFTLGICLGIILLAVALFVNSLFGFLQRRAA